MSNELTLPAGFGPLPTAFAGQQAPNDELGQGIASSYGIMGFKGKVWTAKYQGTETALMRDDGDGPRNSIEVVLIKSSPAVSKIFYEHGYSDGSTQSPDCWSANGIVPEASVQKKVHATCADCPMNAWGSRITEGGKQGKRCSDSRRVAIAPIADIDNEMFGGPMLLRVPAASLKDLKSYGDLLNSYQYPYYACVTRIAFDPKEAYPKFIFSAVRPLTDEEAKKVLALREDPRVVSVLAENQTAVPVTPAGNAPAVPQSPFEQAPVPTSPFVPPSAAPTTQAATQPATQPAPEPAPVAPAPTPAPEPQPATQPAPAAPAAAPNPFGGPAVAVQPAPSAPAPEDEAAPQQAAPQQQAPAANPEPAPAVEAANAPSVSSFDDMLENVLGGK